MASAGDIEAVPLPVIRYYDDQHKGSYLIYSQEWVQDDEIEPGGVLGWNDLINMLPPFYGNGDRLSMSAFAVRAGSPTVQFPAGYLLLFRPVLHENQFAVEWTFRVATALANVSDFAQYYIWYAKENWLCIGRVNTTPTTTLNYTFGNGIFNVVRTGTFAAVQAGLLTDLNAIQILALWVYANMSYYTRTKFENLPVFTGAGRVLLDTIYDYIGSNMSKLDVFVSDQDPASQ